MAAPNRVVTPFTKGNQYGRRPQVSAKQLITRALITELMSVEKGCKDPYGDKPKFERLVKALTKMALGYYYDEETVVDGKVKKVQKFIPPDLSAIREIYDRAEGRPKQQIETKIDHRSEITYRTMEDVARDLRSRGIPIDEIFETARTLDEQTITVTAEVIDDVPED
jgi:hypothetical protein